MDYTTLTLEEVKSAFREVADDAEAAFGALSVHQLNWRPDAGRWAESLRRRASVSATLAVSPGTPKSPGKTRDGPFSHSRLSRR